MQVGKDYFKTIWLKTGNDRVVCAIDQRYLPHRFVVEEFETCAQIEAAIRDMCVRGAGLIGATAGYGMYLAALESASANSFDQHIHSCAKQLVASRPTAVNLSWAVNRQLKAMAEAVSVTEKITIAKQTAIAIADEDAEHCRNIGLHGVSLIEAISKRKKGQIVNVLTHCNAGWLAFVDYGSATAPIYEAHKRGVKLHVWVDETRPRNQGASLTAWELLNAGIPHTVIADNTGGHLMQHGQVDMVITGADRVTTAGDAANKIGTYLKALAAMDNGVPFYVALPSSTFDWSISDGLKEIEIEERGSEELKYIQGLHGNELIKVLVTPAMSMAANYGFDVTPARLITGLITERGVCDASKKSIYGLFPEKQKPV